MKLHPITRRHALGTLVSTSMLALMRSRLSAAAAAPRLRLAFIGVGGRGRGNVQNFAAHEVVAFADVDDVRAAESFAQYPAVPRFRDYRRMLDRHARGIDGVVISTPDHQHLPMARMALQAGKHVYLEKPLAPTIAECRALARAAAESKAVTQLGVQGHSFEALRVLREWIDAGAAGRITEVVLWSDRMKPRDFVRADALPAGGPAPATLDWDLWLGPRPPRPYDERYVPNRWRNWYEFGAGALTDIGVHMFDALTFALDLGAPELVTAGGEPPTAHTAPAWTRVEWSFPAVGQRGPIRVNWTGGWKDGVLVKPAGVPRLPADVLARTDNGMAFVGTEGTLFIPDMRASTRPRIHPVAREREFLANPPARTLPRPIGGHHQDWVDAILTGRAASAPFGYGATLTERVLLGSLAQRTGRPVRWQAETMRCPDNAAAEALLRPAER
jgi:predicted dehydrogenase